MTANNESVALGNWYETHPTVHRITDYTDTDAPITGCGRVLSPYTTTLRYDHAMMFGRPCKVCWRADQEDTDE